MTSSHHAVVVALEAALHDHGWAVATDPARLRAIMSDLLGAQADEQRGALDAIVVSVEEEVPADLRDAGREGAGAIRATLVARLQDWGMASDRASWVVGAWEGLLPEPTAAVPVTAPPPVIAPLAPVVEPVPPTDLPTDLPAALPAELATELPAELPSDGTGSVPLPPTSLPSGAAADDRTSLPPRAPAEDEVEEPAAADEPGRARSPRWLWVAAGTAVLAVAGTWGALAATGDDPQDTDETRSGPTASSSSSAPVTPKTPSMPTGRLISADALAVPRASETSAIAGRVGGVRLTRLGPVDQVGSGDQARVAAAGSQLIGFTLAKGPCQEGPCKPVAQLGLKVSIDGALKRLPAGGPTYAVSAREGATVELVYAADGFDQRLSLVDGAPGPRNIEVLLRSDRTTRVGATEVISPTVSTSSVLNPDRTVRVGKAELFFFDGRDGLPRADRAYLRIDVTYTRPGPGSEFDYEFYPSETSFLAPDGTPYEQRDLDPSDTGQDLVFIVPADLTRGRLVIGGTRQAEAGAITYTLTIPDTPFPIRFDQAG